jgi:hypothetical protein
LSPIASPAGRPMLKTTFFEKHFVWVAHADTDEISLDDVTRGEAVFVSGKLMDPDFVRGIVGRTVPFTSAAAKNFARGERGRGSNRMLLLEPSSGGFVLGVLLLKLTPSDLEALDKFEQVPDVRRRAPIEVVIGSLERTATTYLLKE